MPVVYCGTTGSDVVLYLYVLTTWKQTKLHFIFAITSSNLTMLEQLLVYAYTNKFEEKLNAAYVHVL